MSGPKPVALSPGSARRTRVPTGADASARAAAETAGTTARGCACAAARDAGHDLLVPEAHGARRSVQSRRHVADRDHPQRPCLGCFASAPSRGCRITAARGALAMPDVLPVVTLGSRASVREPFPQVRGGRCRSSAARANCQMHNGFLRPTA